MEGRCDELASLGAGAARLLKEQNTAGPVGMLGVEIPYNRELERS